MLPHVVIVGAGFGGLYAARALGRAPVRVTVIDRRNHHLFQPLLYQVATAALNPSDIAAPIRWVLRKQRNTRVLLGEVTAVDLGAKRVRLTDGEVGFDYAILAPGVTHSYFGHDAWAEHAPGLKTIDDALEIRRRILLAYEAAEREESAVRRREWMTFVIVGGGPTGAELAGALAEIAHHALVEDFRAIDPREARIVLVEGLPRALSSFLPDLSEKARESLEGLGVEVRTGARVTGVDAEGVSLDGERIAARTVIWAAGVAASPLARTLGVPLRAGRVVVEPDLSVPGHPDVFVVGDLAVVVQDGAPVPGVAPAAMQEARHAAASIVRKVRGEPTRPFRYVDKGTFAVLGRGAAVGVLRGGFKLWGFPAWLAWLGIHIVFLIGFRSRLLVLINWAYSYLTYRRGARLITGGGPWRAAAPPGRAAAPPGWERAETLREPRNDGPGSSVV